jgi:hypothetical protein
MSLKEIVKQYGFESEEDFHSMVSKVDLSTNEKIAAFKKWQYHDGTKMGLYKLPTIDSGINYNKP